MIYRVEVTGYDKDFSSALMRWALGVKRHYTADIEAKTEDEAKALMIEDIRRANKAFKIGVVKVDVLA